MERNMKFKLTEKNINSIQSIINKKFCLFQTIPTKPITNNVEEKFKHSIKGKKLLLKLFIKIKHKNI
jgi:hypothetical protein